MKIIPGRKLIPASKTNQEIDRFVRILGRQNCKNKITELDEQLKNDEKTIYNEYYLKTKNPLLNELREYFNLLKSGKSINKKRSATLRSLFSTAVTVNQIYKDLSDNGKKVLKEKLRADEVRPLLFEIQTVTHFLQNNYKIRYNDLDKLSLANKNFDFLVEKDDFIGEVECKWKDLDSGRKIKRIYFYPLADKLARRFEGNEKSILIDISVENILKIDEREMKDIADKAFSSLENGNKTAKTNNGITLHFKDLPGIKSIKSESEVEKATREYQSRKAHFAIHSTDESTIIIRAESERNDTRVMSIVRSLKETERQFTKNFPALIAAYIEGVNESDWETIRTNSNLQYKTVKYLDNQMRSFIHTVSYTSKQAFVSKGAITYFQGPAVSWQNRNCKFETPINPFNIIDN